MDRPAGAVRSSLADEVVLVGEVAFVVYTDDRSGFGVVEVCNLRDDDRGTARATGPLGRLVPGQPVALYGRWTMHPTYGETFAASYFTLSAPRSTKALEAFLASDHFPGIGARLAASLVDTFGLELPDVIADDPDALTSARGITDRLRDVVVDGWRQAGVLAELVARLAATGLDAAAARWLLGEFGDDAGATLDDDPYVLLGAPGVGWRAVERLAQSQGVATDDPCRLVAAAAWAVRQRRADRGDVAVDADDLVAATAQLLRCDAQVAGVAVDRAVERGALDAWAGPTGPKTVWYALPEDGEAERQLAEAIVRLDAEVTPHEVTDAEVADVDAALTAEQRAAVRMAFATAVSVITGGPGTGKTRTVSAVLACAAAAEQQVALCAPTGRAAKRLEELSGHRATTIHRLLEARPVQDGDERFSFSYDSQRRLPHDLIIADEWSMADLGLAHALITAVPDGGRLLLVGDVDQLPPVGPGAVLRDLLATAEAGGPVTSTTLRTVHRQAAASRIVTLAHELKAGTATAPRGRDGDVFAVPQAASGAADRVAEIVAVRAPDFFGCRPSDVQVLSPRYGGPAGVDRLNEVLRDRLNPRGSRRPVGGFCEGDRVVQTRNNVELDITNGEVGEIIDADPTDQRVRVAFPAGTVRLGLRDVRDLRPAWCLTVHKSQGGQWPVVVLVLDATHRRMLWRELVYTAVTRAMKGLLLVGSPRLLETAARRAGSGVARRRTSLSARLQVLMTPGS